jgi:hypothetical protein
VAVPGDEESQGRRECRYTSPVAFSKPPQFPTERLPPQHAPLARVAIPRAATVPRLPCDNPQHIPFETLTRRRVASRTFPPARFARCTTVPGIAAEQPHDHKKEDKLKPVTINWDNDKNQIGLLRSLDRKETA